MATKQCSACGLDKANHEFQRIGKICRPCRNERQRVRRAESGNAETRKYEKTPNGFLMRAYRNMESRVTGVQWRKAHLYEGKSLLERDDFYTWSLSDPTFARLFAAWKESGHDRKLTPSVDRIDSAGGYELDNMQWVTHSVNSKRGNESRARNKAYFRGSIVS
jgi:hypothetical protein